MSHGGGKGGELVHGRKGRGKVEEGRGRGGPATGFAAQGGGIGGGRGGRTARGTTEMEASGKQAIRSLNGVAVTAGGGGRW